MARAPDTRERSLRSPARPLILFPFPRPDFWQRCSLTKGGKVGVGWWVLSQCRPRVAGARLSRAVSLKFAVDPTSRQRARGLSFFFRRHWITGFTRLEDALITHVSIAERKALGLHA